MKPITEHRKFESIEAYLAFEEKSEVRHEYYLENLIEKPAESYLHDLVIANLLRILKLHFIENKEIFTSKNFQLRINKENIVFYPDVLISEAPQNHFYSFLPIIIAEVLSESSRHFDMLDKFIQYRKLTSLEYYFLVEPEKHLVFLYKKIVDNNWQIDSFTSLTNVIELPTLQISIALKDIYQA